MIPVQLIVAGAIAAVSFAGAWQIQGVRYEAILAEREAVQATALAEATAKALATTIKLQKAKDDAERKYNRRLADTRRDADSSRSALVGLSQAADTALRRASDTHSACQSVAATSTDLLQQCSVRYQSVASEADGWVSEALRLREAWPK